MTDNTEDYGLVFAFPKGCNNKQFIRGFEAGEICGRLCSEANQIKLPVHTGNKEILVRAARNCGWSVAFEDTDIDGWVIATFILTKRPVLHVVTK